MMATPVPLDFIMKSKLFVLYTFKDYIHVHYFKPNFQFRLILNRTSSRTFLKFFRCPGSVILQDLMVCRLSYPLRFSCQIDNRLMSPTLVPICRSSHSGHLIRERVRRSVWSANVGESPRRDHLTAKPEPSDGG